MKYSVSAEAEGQLRLYQFDTLKEAVAFADKAEGDNETVPIIKVGGRMIESPDELQALLDAEAEASGNSLL